MQNTNDLLFNDPVWIDIDDDINRKNMNLVITYIHEDAKCFQPNIEKMFNYAKKINADFVVLKGSTQVSPEQEIFRVKRFVEAYDRTIFFKSNIYVKDNCPNLFDIVPSGKVGINNLDIPEIHKHEFGIHRRKKINILKYEALSKFPIIDAQINSAIEFEADLITTSYDNSVIICDKQHVNLFNPITFPFRKESVYDSLWMEINLYREGFDVFPLDNIYNYNIANLLDKEKDTSCIIQYPFSWDGPGSVMPAIIGENVKLTWIDDNDITGYKEKENIELDDYQILCLGHSDDQLLKIKDRAYLTKFNLNNINCDQRFSESRIYSLDFNDIFDNDKKYVGIVTASWNQKYIGLNPIDKMEQWQAVREINNNSIICANGQNSYVFGGIERPVPSIMIKDLDNNKIDEILKSVGIKKKYAYSVVSNQIITQKEILKELFNFYQKNNVLKKVQQFIEKYRLKAHQKKYQNRICGYITEAITMFWIAENGFDIMPQEIVKKDWYK